MADPASASESHDDCSLSPARIASSGSEQLETPDEVGDLQDATRQRWSAEQIELRKRYICILLIAYT